MLSEHTLQCIFGDKAYDSDAMDEDLDDEDIGPSTLTKEPESARIALAAAWPMHVFSIQRTSWKAALSSSNISRRPCVAAILETQRFLKYGSLP